MVVIGNEQNPIYIGGIKQILVGAYYKNSKEKSEFDNVKFSYLSGFRKDYDEIDKMFTLKLLKIRVKITILVVLLKNLLIKFQTKNI